MKPFLEKTEFFLTDIEELISNGAEENLYLEFKHADSLSLDEKFKVELSKDISAFANADGGILIYGVQEKNRKAHKITWIDTTKLSKEWLQQTIDSRVTRRISTECLKIIPIDNPINSKEQIFVLKFESSPLLTAK